MMESPAMNHKPAVRKIDAVDLLSRDHDAIRQLFGDYERLIVRPDQGDRKAQIVCEICLALSVHSQIEEEIFYPAVRAALGWNDVIDHALCEHGGINELIAKLDDMEPGDHDYDATVAVLGAYVIQHMDEEQQDLFPKLCTAGLDTAALGARLAQRRGELHDDVAGAGSPNSAPGIAAGRQSGDAESTGPHV
jgi:Hemerythrin HHE cation binding domain